MPGEKANTPMRDDTPRRQPAAGGDDGERKPGSSGKRAMPPRRTWTWFIIILVVNFLVVRFLMPREGEPTVIPYTLFKQEVARSNVEAIYSHGESLTGRFRTPVRYPAHTSHPLEPGPRARRRDPDERRTR